MVDMAIPMDDDRLRRYLLSQLEGRGWKARVVPVGRLTDIRESIEHHRAQGSFEEAFYADCLSSFDYEVTVNEPEAASIIIVATRAPFIKLTFTSGDRDVPIIIPPTYSYAIDSEVQAVLLRMLSPSGYRVFSKPLPKKLLAACSGLAKYGRNNIAYVDGMGSYCRLIAFYTDLPCREHEWQQPECLVECTNCQTCCKRCPTGAIADDRFLIRGERCLTYHNEHSWDFPSWISPDSHRCLVGCLYCQVDCSVNRKVGIRVEAGPSLGETETNLVLCGEAPEHPTPAYQQMRELTDLLNLSELARNLRVLLQGEGNTERAMALISNQ